MATTHGKGKAHVVSASKPMAEAVPKAMSNAHVGMNGVQKISSGKMAGGGKVTLGTSHGNHKVNHAI